MINKENCIPLILTKLKKLEVGQKIDLRPYKRNRSVLIEKKDKDRFKIKENGFFQDEFEVTYRELNKSLKKILKREFPRSNKIRIYKLSSHETTLTFKKI